MFSLGSILKFLWMKDTKNVYYYCVIPCHIPLHIIGLTVDQPPLFLNFTFLI